MKVEIMITNCTSYFYKNISRKGLVKKYRKNQNIRFYIEQEDIDYYKNNLRKFSYTTPSSKLIVEPSCVAYQRHDRKRKKLIMEKLAKQYIENMFGSWCPYKEFENCIESDTVTITNTFIEGEFIKVYYNYTEKGVDKKGNPIKLNVWDLLFFYINQLKN